MNIAKQISDFYQKVVRVPVQFYASQSSKLTLPKLTSDSRRELYRSAAKELQEEPVLLKLSGDFVVVGDIHGHILDLLRIFQELGFPPENKYLFLGDYVDRGEFSIETLDLLLALKSLFPQQIYLLRGNHEFLFVNENHDFLHEFTQTNSSSLLSEVYHQLPLAAVVNERMFCVHGRIGSNSQLNIIKKLRKPYQASDSEIIDALLWSDPSNERTGFAASPRGRGFLFGIHAVEWFLKTFHLQLIIRSHEVSEPGYEEYFGGTLISIFSASNYCGISGNKASVFFCKDMSVKKFFPLHYPRRESAEFHSILQPLPKESHPKIPLIANLNLEPTKLLSINSFPLNLILHSFRGRSAYKNHGSSMVHPYISRSQSLTNPFHFINIQQQLKNKNITITFV
jgi:protein phosphatase